MRVASLITAVILVTTIVPPAAAQSGAPVGYRALVDAYRESGPLETESLLSLSRDQVSKAVDQALETSAGWTWEELRGAAMLHSDAAVRRARERDSRSADFHLVIAQRLLERVVSLSPPQDDFVWRWHIALPALLSELGASGLSNRLRAYASQRWKLNGARAEFSRGMQFEARGNSGGVMLRPGEQGLKLDVDELQSHWFVLAAQAHAAALRLDPHLSAAALHLGRIRMIQGKSDEASTLFQRVVGDVDPAADYLAHLFLGALDEREDRFDEAERRYRQAMAIWRHGQSAPLALSQLLSRRGRDAEARKVVVERFATSPRSIEPGWAFAAGLTIEGATRFALLRAETWK